MQYNPSVPPQAEDDLLPYLQDEFLRVAQSFNDITEGVWDIRYEMPKKFKRGLVIYLSGKPGADPLGTGQEGLYRYSSTNTWVYIG